MEKTQKPPPKDLKELIIFTDGGARGNPGPAACAFVMKDSAGKLRLLCGKYLGEATNNFAEYQGVIFALEEIFKLKAINPKAVELNFNLDSNLVVNQLNGTFKVKDKDIRQLVVHIRELEGKFNKISYKYIPREKNKLADKLVNEELDKY